jgi:Cu+-exporting ATPase
MTRAEPAQHSLHHGADHHSAPNHSAHCHAGPTAHRALEEAKPVPAGTRWTCPMHPEIVRGEPGNCPICGMALEPADVPVDGSNPELIA